jgi:hypothetical protein
MHKAGGELPRIPILGSKVNKGLGKGRGYQRPRPSPLRRRFPLATNRTARDANSCGLCYAEPALINSSQHVPHLSWQPVHERPA